MCLSCLFCVSVRDLKWHDLDLILERAPVPPYQRGPLNVILPLFYGILLGFGGTLLAWVSLFLIIRYFSQRRPTKQPEGHSWG